MGRKLEFMLRNWGDHHIRHDEHASEYGDNILYAAGLLQGRVQDSSWAGSKILCEERSSTVREVDRAVAKLPFAQKRALVGWYCSPLKDDGTPHTKAQIAMKLRTCRSSFESSLRKAKGYLAIELT